MNLYPEAVEAPNEQTKITLYGRPGIKIFKALSGDPLIRAMWSGGGRLFVVHGTTLSEVTSAAVQTNRPGTVAQTDFVAFPNFPALDPAQIFSNGHQLMVIGGGKVYCDNGDTNGVAPARLSTSGTGDAHSSPKSLTTTGGPFTPGINWLNTPIDIEGAIYTITSVPDANTLMLSGPGLADKTGVIWTSPATGPQLTGYTGGVLDGYFIVSRPPGPGTSLDPPGTDLGRNFNISKLFDGVWWDPLDYDVKSGAPDYLSSVLCDHEELWLFGTETTEVWSNVGDPNFPFQRNPGAFIHEGISAMFAQCSVGLSICGLSGGANGQTVAFQVQGLQPKRISTHAQEAEWNGTGYKVSDATSFGYSEGGHTFWQVNFWAMNRTWVYDLTTGMWHERAAWNSSTSNFVRYIPWYHAFVPEWGTNGKHIVGDPSTGKLYEMSTNFCDDDGADIEYIRAFPHLLNEDRFAYHHRFELYMETGVSPQVQVGLDWSDDRGHSFSSFPALSPIKNSGLAGDAKKRLVWRRLGKARDRVYRIGVQGKGKVALIDAYLEATQGFA